MNWDLQLAAAMTAEEKPLVLAARRARDLSSKGRYGAALKILFKHLLAAKRQGADRHRAYLSIHMGKVYLHWMFQVAFKCFRDAADLSRASGFTRGEMVAESAIGELYLAWKEPAKALDHYERCLFLAEDCGGLWWRRDVLVRVVECLDELGDSERARAEERRLCRMDREITASLWSELEEREPRVGDGAVRERGGQ